VSSGFTRREAPACEWDPPLSLLASHRNPCAQETQGWYRYTPVSRSLLPALCLVLLFLSGVGLIASCLPDPHSLIGRPCDEEHVCGDDELVCCRGTCQLASQKILCLDPTPDPDGGGAEDGGPRDGGTADGGVSDAGVDAGTDGGQDGGVDPGPPDAGSPDAGSPDAGSPDAGPPPDAGCPPNLVPAGGAEPDVDINDHFDGTGRGTISLSTAVVRTGVGAIKMTRNSTASGVYGLELKEGQLGTLRVGAVYCVSAWVRRGTTRGEILLTPRHYSSSGDDDTLPGRVTPADDSWHRIIIPTALTPTYNRDITFFTSVNTADGSEYYADDIRFWEAPGTTCDEACAP
jgi:hypothetical protein